MKKNNLIITLFLTLTITMLIGCGSDSGSSGDSGTPTAGLATIKGQFVYRNKADWSGTKVYIMGSSEALGSPVLTGSDGKFSKNVNTGFNYNLQVSENTYLVYVTTNINVATAKVYDIGIVTMDYVGSPPPTPNL